MTMARSRSPAAVAIVAVLALGIAGWVVVNSAFFAIRDVRVEGAHSVPIEEIREVAAVPSGKNLIMLRTDSVAERLEGHPWILDATVVRDLPATVVIRVVERKAGGWLRHPGGVAVVAGDGIVLERLGGPPPRLPEVGSWPEALSPGQRIGDLTEAVHVTSSMPAPLRRQIASVSLEGTDLLLLLRNGGEVLYGPPTEIPAKNRALGNMLRWAAGEGIAVRTIDVGVPSAPSLEPVGARANRSAVSPS